MANAAAKWIIMALATKSYLYNAGFSQDSLLFSRMNPVLSLLNVAVLNIIYFLVLKRKNTTKCNEVLYIIINQRSFSYDSESGYWEMQIMLTLKVRKMCYKHLHFKANTGK